MNKLKNCITCKYREPWQSDTMGDEAARCLCPVPRNINNSSRELIIKEHAHLYNGCPTWQEGEYAEEEWENCSFCGGRGITDTVEGNSRCISWIGCCACAGTGKVRKERGSTGGAIPCPDCGETGLISTYTVQIDVTEEGFIRAFYSEMPAIESIGATYGEAVGDLKDVEREMMCYLKEYRLQIPIPSHVICPACNGTGKRDV